MNYLNSNDQLISVIVPTFNSEGTIIRCINSIFSQIVDYQIEIIVIDDNSTDNTLKLIKAIHKKSKFEIKIIQNKINKGSGFCRQIGIDISKGNYIAFLDSDDYWLENKLFKQISFMERKTWIQISYSDYLSEISSFEKLFFYLEETPLMVDLKKNKYKNFIPNSSVMIRSSFAKKVSYPQIRVRNDFVYWNKLLSINRTKAYNFDSGKPYFIYGSNIGISGNKLKLVLIQWNIYRNYFNYSHIESIYGVFLNIFIFLFKLVKMKFKKINLDQF